MTLSGSSSSPTCNPLVLTSPQPLCRAAGAELTRLTDAPGQNRAAVTLSMVVHTVQPRACEPSPWCCAGRASLAHGPGQQQQQQHLQHQQVSPGKEHNGHSSATPAPCRLLICGSGERGQAQLAGALLHPLRDAGVHTLTLPSLIVAGQGDVVQGMVRVLKQACEG